jgi:isoleucyl-tRNA synthetase
VEIEVEKALGISGKQQIEALGVAEFNRLCRESVFKYRGDWEKLSARIGYWLDYTDPYVTYSNNYIESVWWALKTLSERDLLYRGHKILPYCPRCGTALSTHELALGYEDDTDDPSVFVALEVSGQRATGSGQRVARILVWTTTPWTLVSNAGLAVKADLEYAEVLRKDGKDARTLILAESRLKAVLGEDYADRWDIVARITGAEMVGWTYKRPFDWLEYPAGTNHEIVVAEDWVSDSDGTGVVHMSPAFGADDYAAGRRHNLGFLQPIDARGNFPASMPKVGGMFFKDADPILTEDLKERGVLFKSGRITHRYPFCWRCGTPLLYYARTSWFVRTTAYRDRMLARNARVNWHPPEIGEKRFTAWLATNIDWAISRDRFWGTPLPVWVCDADDTHHVVVGGYAELAERAGKTLGADFDPHKPFIDAYDWPCTHAGCAGRMHRVPEVIDAWFDSGSMPFAQWHYPFENAETFAAQYPADFIAEGLDQTRGWFYSLLAIGVGLEGAGNGQRATGNGTGSGTGSGQRAAGSGHEHWLPELPPYKSVVVNDLLLDASGQKMSKSRGNVVDPWVVIEKYGVDSVRLFLMAASDVGIPRRFDEQTIRELAGRFLVTLKNVYSGIFAEYANFGWAPSAADPALEDRPALDRWILGRLSRVEHTVNDALANYDPTAAARAVMAFVDHDVSNWYVRQSRHRFYEVSGADNRAAFATLHEVLVSVCRLLAPIAPFVTDWMHRQLVGTSVHLAPFVETRARRIDVELEAAMDAVRELARLGRAAREDAKVKVRQPLARVVCVAPGVSDAAMSELVPLLAAELNVKRVEFATSADALVTLEAKPNFRTLGKKFGKRTPQAAQAIAGFSNDRLREFERGTSVIVTVEGESHELAAEDVTIVRRASGDLTVQEDGGRFAAIDPTITPELRREGMARELVSRVQRMRKERGLAVSDRIEVSVTGPAELGAVITEHRVWIADEVLATRLDFVDGVPQATAANVTVLDLDGIEAGVAITRNN